MSQPAVDVCLIVGHYYPILGGSSARLRRYMPGLTKRGVKMRVLTARNGDLPADEQIEGIPVHRIALGDRPPGDIIGAAVRHFAETNYWPKIALVASPIASSMVLPLLQLRSRGVRVAVMVMMVGVVCEGADWRLRLRRRVFFQILNQLTHRFIANSSAMKRWLLQEGITPARVQVILNGVNLNRFQRPPSPEAQVAARRALNLPTTGEIVLYVGMICQRKGPRRSDFLAVCGTLFVLVAATYPPDCSSGFDLSLHRRSEGICQTDRLQSVLLYTQ